VLELVASLQAASSKGDRQETRRGEIKLKFLLDKFVQHLEE
jgi:hypothetical protein